jgi:hypothetical protein
LEHIGGPLVERSCLAVLPAARKASSVQRGYRFLLQQQTVLVANPTAWLKVSAAAASVSVETAGTWSGSPSP